MEKEEKRGVKMGKLMEDEWVVVVERVNEVDVDDEGDLWEKVDEDGEGV